MALADDDISELSYTVLVATAQLPKGEATTVNIVREVAHRTGRLLNVGTLHAVLPRLVRAGKLKTALESKKVASTHSGMRRRYYILSAQGAEFLLNLLESRRRLERGLSL